MLSSLVLPQAAPRWSITLEHLTVAMNVSLSALSLNPLPSLLNLSPPRFNTNSMRWYFAPTAHLPATRLTASARFPPQNSKKQTSKSHILTPRIQSHTIRHSCTHQLSMGVLFQIIPTGNGHRDYFRRRFPC